MVRNFYILAYDIADDRRRQKIAKLCESTAERVQGSVFEAHLTQAELDQLIKRVGKVFEEKEDSLRIYQLCIDCRQKIRTEGVGSITPEPSLRII